MSWKTETRLFSTLLTVALFFTLGASVASAQTTIMPDRDALAGTPIVVWGNTYEASGPITISFGDGSTDATPAFNTGNQSYIALNHTYTVADLGGDKAKTFTVTLNVGGGGGTEDTAEVTVWDPAHAGMTASELEDIEINMAIEDGLRWQYVFVSSREFRHDNGWNFANWSGGNSFSALATLAFENHSHLASPACGASPKPECTIYSPVVQGGLNYVFAILIAQPLGAQLHGDPCISGGIIPASPNTLCNGLREGGSPNSYRTPIALLPITASQLPGAIVGVGAAIGQSYLEVAQRIVNTMAWGMQDKSDGTGGWRYNMNDSTPDGSTHGWNALGFLDGQAFGATVPAFALSEFEKVTEYLTNDNGTMGYSVAGSIPNSAKTGVRLQVLSLLGVPAGGTTAVTTVTPQASIDWLDDGWELGGSCDWGSNGHPSSPGLTQGKNCVYALFNIFKGLKLYGVTTLAGVARADDDWHRDYQAHLASIQSSPTATNGGSFAVLHGHGFNTYGDTALALLVLSPTALILPDPVTFSELGLKHGVPLTVDPVDNDALTSHTVTANAVSVSGTPVPTATVSFVVTGVNGGVIGSGDDITDGDGNATFTYTDTSGGGVDNIQAFIGSAASNVVVKNWIPPNEPPDITGAAPTATCLWPPNHKFTSVGIGGITDPDGDVLTISITGITSDEPTSTAKGVGGKDKGPDASFADGTASLRVERQGGEDGRVYEISFDVSDGTETVSGTVQVGVPHDQKKPLVCGVDSGQIYDATKIN